MEYLTTTEAAGVLKINPKTLARWLEEGRVPGALKLGRQWRISPADLKALLKPPGGQVDRKEGGPQPGGQA